MDTNKSNTRLGILNMILSSFGFSAMAIAVKLSGSALPIPIQVFTRNFMTMFLGYFLVRKSGAKFFGRPGNLKHLILRSAFGLIGICMNFYAIRNLNAADAAVLQKSSPFFVSLFAALILNDKLDNTGIFTIILAFIGAVFVSKPKFDMSILPALAALGSALTSGLAYTIIGMLRGKEEPSVIMFFFSMFSCIVMLPFIAYNFTVPTLSQLFYMLLIGFFATMGQFYITKSYSVAPPSSVSLYNYTGVAFSALLGYLLLGHTVNIYSFIGIVIIFIATLIAFKHKSKRGTV